MRTYTLDRSQELPAPLDTVFPFFSKPENLQQITPPSMDMRVLTPPPLPMHPGAIIDYVVKANGLPLRWTTCISEYQPPHRFVDVQLRGPYSFWHHTHTFEAQGACTRIHDRVVYMLPFGPIGQLIHALAVKRQLDSIFDFRSHYLANEIDWSAL